MWSALWALRVCPRDCISLSVKRRPHEFAPGARSDFARCKDSFAAPYCSNDSASKSGTEIRTQGVALHQMFGPQFCRSENIHDGKVGVHSDCNPAFRMNSKSPGGLGGDQRRDPFERKLATMISAID